MEVDRISKCELKAVKCSLKRKNLIKGQRFKLWKKTEMEEREDIEVKVFYVQNKEKQLFHIYDSSRLRTMLI